MRKARVLITKKCDRDCDGCCNKSSILDSMKDITDLQILQEYQVIMITGGEPILVPEKLMDLLHWLDEHMEHTTPIYLYSARYDRKIYEKIMSLINGLHFTLHAEANDEDIADLKALSLFLKGYGRHHQSLRLAIDTRVYSRYDLSNIDLSAWSVVRKMTWLKDAPLPAGEELLYMKKPLLY
jgi:hypothetical protein